MNGGQTTRSTAENDCRRGSIASTSARPSAMVVFIFQLPATIGLRAHHSQSLLQRGHARQDLAFDELERGAAAGRDVAELVGQAGLLDGLDRLAAADDRRRARIGHGVGHGERARGEARILEDAHRAVPQHRAGCADLGVERVDGARADVDDHLVGADVVDRARCAAARVPLKSVVTTTSLGSTILSPATQQVVGGLDQVSFEQALADLAALRP